MPTAGSTHVRVEAKEWGAALRVLTEKLSEREAMIVESEAADAGPMNRWRLALDCSQVTFLPSVGVGVLVRLHGRCREGGGKLVVFGLSSQLMSLIKLTGVDRLISCVADEAAAAKAMRA
jgi:anti-anti-sigma factor